MLGLYVGDTRCVWDTQNVLIMSGGLSSMTDKLQELRRMQSKQCKEYTTIHDKRKQFRQSRVKDIRENTALKRLTVRRAIPTRMELSVNDLC